ILYVSFHFTIRQGGVAVQVINAGSDSVRVIIVLNEAGYTPPPLPQKNHLSISIEDLDRLNPDAASIYREVLLASLFVNPVGAAILARGILTDSYDMPLASSVHDSENVVSNVPVFNLPNPTPH